MLLNIILQPFPYLKNKGEKTTATTKGLGACIWSVNHDPVAHPDEDGFNHAVLGHFEFLDHPQTGQVPMYKLLVKFTDWHVKNLKLNYMIEKVMLYCP